MFQNEKTTGSLSISYNKRFYTQKFVGEAWMASHLIQFLDEVIESPDPPTALLKLLGYTMVVAPDRPLRRPARQWVEVDLEARVLQTNSPMIREAVEEVSPAAGRPYTEAALRRIHAILDRYDFTVKLFN